MDLIVGMKDWPYSEDVVPLKEVAKTLGMPLEELKIRGRSKRSSLHRVEGDGGLDQGEGGDGLHRDVLGGKGGIEAGEADHSGLI